MRGCRQPGHHERVWGWRHPSLAAAHLGGAYASCGSFLPGSVMAVHLAAAWRLAVPGSGQEVPGG
jgi:hypothetical protein